MKLALTSRLVDELEVEKGRSRTVYFDTHRDAPQGFALRVTAKGARSFYVLRTLKATGQRRWIHLGSATSMTLDAARTAAWGEGGDIARGIDTNVKRRAAKAQARAARLQRTLDASEWTVLDMLRSYLEARLGRLSPVTAREYARITDVDIAKTELAVMRARDVVRDDVRRVVARIARRAPALAAHVLALLRAAFRWAEAEEVLVTLPDGRREARQRVERDPTRRIEEDLKLGRNVRKRYLSDSEIVTFWRGLDELKLAWATFARIILLCGTRRGETYRARWRDIDLEARLWHIPAEHRKGRAEGTRGERQALDIPLAPLAVELLAALREVTGRREYIFRAQGFSIGIIGQEMKRASGLEDITIHDLRRTTASGLQGLEAPPHVISIVLGHSREAGATQTDAAYAHGRRAGEHRLWLERWAAHVQALVRGSQAQTKKVLPWLG